MFKFGFGRDIITPTINHYISCSGNFYDYCTDVHDDVYVKSLVIDDGNNKALVITADLLFHSIGLLNSLSAYALEKYNIPISSTIINYSHAHTSSAAHFYNLSTFNTKYEEFLIESCKRSIDRAFLTMIEGSLEYGFAYADWAMSRRYILEDGSCEFRPSPQNLRDKEAVILKFIDKKGRIRGIIVNYGCHPVFKPELTTLSAEFPGRVCQYLETEYYGATAMYIQGAAGSSRPRLAVDADAFRKNCNFIDVDTMAWGISKAVITALSSNKMKDINLNISSANTDLKLYFQTAPKVFFKEQSEKLHPTMAERAKYIYDNYEMLKDYIPLRCGLLRLSQDFYIVYMGGEPCYELISILQAVMKDKRFIFSGYADDCAYLVTDQQVDEGGYEPTSFMEFMNKGTVYEKGLDEKYKKAFENLLKEL